MTIAAAITLLMIVARAADGQGDDAPGTLLSVAAASMRRQPVVAVA